MILHLETKAIQHSSSILREKKEMDFIGVLLAYEW